MRQYASQEEISKVRQQLAKIEEQVRRNQTYFPHDITIDNKSGKDLKLTINLENNQNSTSRITLQSKIGIPNNSTLTHIINTQNRSDKDLIYEDSIYEEINEDRRQRHKNFFNEHTRSQEFQRHKMNSTIRSEQKFLPLSRQKTQESKSKDISYEQQNPSKLIHHSQQVQNNYSQQKQRENEHGKQILIAEDEDEQSDIIGNQEINQLVQSHYIKNPYTSERKNSQNYEAIQEEKQNQENRRSNHNNQIIDPVKLPFSIKKEQDLFDTPKFSTAEKQPTSLNNTQRLIQSLKTLQKSGFNKPVFDTSQKWKVEPIIASSPRKSDFKFENSKTYTQRSKEKMQFKKLKNSQRQIRLYETFKTNYELNRQSKISHNNCKSRKKYENQNITTQRTIVHQKKAKRKADDLFIQRKNQYLKKLDRERRQINSIRKYSRSHRDFQNELKEMEIIDSKSSRIRVSPRAIKIGQRLHSSKGKVPCEHFNRFSESQERQRFNSLTKQNVLVCKYLTRKEKEQLFQTLRSSKESISLWSTKIANHVLCKIRKATDSIVKAA